MALTMKEMAEKLKVNVSTVSRALKDDPSISKELRQKIADFAEENNYQKRKVLKNEIVFIIDEKIFESSNYFFTDIMKSIIKEVQQLGYIYQLYPQNSDLLVTNDLKNSLNKAAGIIVTGCYNDKFILDLKNQDVPMVLLDYYLPLEDITAVLIDNIDGLMEGMHYLASLGHKRVLYLAGELQEIGAQDRLIGYQRAVDRFGFDKSPDLVAECDFQMKSAYEVTRDYFSKCKERPTAIVGVNDIVALGAIQAIKELNLKIPEEISVLGFDDIALAREMVPNLTTMAVRKDLLSQLAVQTLAQKINREEIKFNKLLVNPKLVIRDSTGTCREHT